MPTHLNPADVATRPCRVAQEDRWKLWTRGPDFLCRSREEWKDKFGVEHVENVSPMVATIKSETKHKADATSFMGYTLERTNSLSKATQVLSSVIRCFKRWKNGGRTSNAQQGVRNARRLKALLAPIRLDSCS